MFSALANCFRPSRQIELPERQPKDVKDKARQMLTSQKDAEGASSEKPLIPNKEFVLIEPFDTVCVRYSRQSKS